MQQQQQQQPPTRVNMCAVHLKHCCLLEPLFPPYVLLSYILLHSLSVPITCSAGHMFPQTLLSWRCRYSHLNNSNSSRGNSLTTYSETRRTLCVIIVSTQTHSAFHSRPSLPQLLSLITCSESTKHVRMVVVMVVVVLVVVVCTTILSSHVY